MSLKLKVTPVFEKLQVMWEHKTIFALQGGSRSSKTFSVLQKLCLECLQAEKPLTIIIGGKTLRWVMRNVYPDFKEILGPDHFDCWNANNWHGNDHAYTLAGSRIIFEGFSDHDGADKAHGMKCDIMFLNEANFMRFDVYNQLAQRCNGKRIIDFNPGFSKKHWIFRSIIPLPECYFFRSTYKHNTFLPQAIIDQIEGYEPTEYNIARGTADSTLWDVYGLGKMAVIEGLVFPKFNEVAAMHWPQFNDWTKFGYGLDFGFSNDPSALTECSLFENQLYLRERIYEKGLTSIENPSNPNQMSLERRFKEFNIRKNYKIWADGARPEMIQDLKNSGYSIAGAKKGAGSIIEGLNCMKYYKINIHEDSDNLINEFRNYKWKEDLSGNQLRVPVDAFNHGIDGIRYNCVMALRPSRLLSAKYDTSAKVNTGASKYEW